MINAPLEPWPLPDEFLIELGRISASWVALESYLDLCLGKLAGYNALLDVRPFIVLRHSSFPQKLDAFEALCDFLQPEFERLQNYKVVTSKLRSAQKCRNKYMHNSISRNPDTSAYELAEGSARGKIKTSVAAITPADLNRVAVEIRAAMIELHELVIGKPHTQARRA